MASEQQVCDSLPTVLLKICFEYAKEPFGVVESTFLPTGSHSWLLTDKKQTKLFVWHDTLNKIEILNTKGTEHGVIKKEERLIGFWDDEPCIPATHSFSFMGPKDDEVIICEIEEDGLRQTHLSLPSHWIGDVAIRRVFTHLPSSSSSFSSLFSSSFSPFSLPPAWTVVASNLEFCVFNCLGHILDSGSYKSACADIKLALLHAQLFTSDGGHMWVTTARNDYDLLFIDSKSQKVSTRVSPYCVFAAQEVLKERTLIKHVCCGKDGLVYVLVNVEFQLILASMTFVLVYTLQGDYVRRWKVDYDCTRLLLGPNNSLYLLCGNRVLTCG